MKLRELLLPAESFPENGNFWLNRLFVAFLLQTNDAACFVTTRPDSEITDFLEKNIRVQLHDAFPDANLQLTYMIGKIGDENMTVWRAKYFMIKNVPQALIPEVRAFLYAQGIKWPLQWLPVPHQANGVIFLAARRLNTMKHFAEELQVSVSLE